MMHVHRQRSLQIAIVHSQDMSKRGVGSLERNIVMWVVSLVDRSWRR